MPAYSYTSGSPIGISALNPTTGQFIEVIYTASGSTYFYSSIAWLPEIQIQDQINVFTRPNALGPETQMINGTDFNFGPNETIVFVNAPSGQVVLRRSTDLSKMVLSYVDGAKFTSRQLNSTMHQLLFIAQEKANFETNIFNYYPVSVVAQAWNSGTSYVVNDVVIHSGGIYVCIANSTNNNPASSPAFWTLQNPQSNGFYVTGYNAPVNIHLGTMADGQTLVWSGAQKRFQAGFAINSSANLSDYDIDNLLNNQILEYSSTKWRNKTIQWTPTLTGTDLVFSKHIFSSVLTSFASPSLVLPGYLSAFNSGSTQVMPNAATVYDMLVKTIPSGAEPRSYFQSIDNSITQALQNLKNPVKAKFEWDLSYGNPTQKNESNVGLYGPFSTFWDHPNEFYSPLGLGSVWSHGVQDPDGSIYKISPWWSHRATVGNPTTYLDLKPKIYGYGLSAFYLSVPECHIPSFYIPVVQSNGNFTVLNNLSLSTSFRSTGDHSAQTNWVPRDYYLVWLRDFAFAAARSGADPNNGQNDKTQDNNIRHCKGNLIWSEYRGFEDFSQYRRREQATETPETVLWKIPESMIYYNTAALALGNKNLAENYISSSSIRDTNVLKKDVRFTGFSALSTEWTSNNSAVNTNRNTSVTPMGVWFKAERYWADWQNRWSTDAVSSRNFRFNEADIDWALFDSKTTNVKHFDTFASTLSTASISYNTLIQGQQIFPWSFRPNFTRVPANNNYASGTHVLNLDYNKLFSESHNYIPDPTTTYVFRLVLDDTTTAAYFKETGNPGSKPKINSSIILEHGFRDSGHSNDTESIPGNDKHKLYPMHNGYYGTQSRFSVFTRSKIDKSKVTVRVISEQLEQDLQTPAKLRYVIKIAVTVPMLKHIGFSKIFRKMQNNINTADYLKTGATYNGPFDTEIDSGPWSLSTRSVSAGLLNGVSGPNNIIGTFDNGSNAISDLSVYLVSGNALTLGYAPDLVQGRNECAVRFTRVGIPNDFWLRVSVLNTDASVSLINPSTLNFLGT